MGTDIKVSVANAAFADGELINAMDFDAMSAGHITPAIVAAALAQAEYMHVSGEDLILALAISHEVCRRIRSAVTGLYPSISEGPHKGMIKWPDVYGYSAWALAASVAAGKIMGFDRVMMANAIGIAAYITSPDVMVKWTYTTPVKMVKYGLPGWGAHAGIYAAMLAEAGYTGDTEVFKDGYGYWRFTGHDKWDSGIVVENLGREWHAHKITYKQYPCGHCMHGWLDAFIKIIEEKDLKPDDIEEVTITPHPIAYFPAWSENKLETVEDHGFSIPYLLSCAAYRINPVNWLDDNIRNSMKLRRFRNRVKIKINIDEKSFGLYRLKDPETRYARVEVIARGKTYVKETIYPKGTWKSEDARNTDEELIKKFIGNLTKKIPKDKANTIAQIILKLEEIKDINKLINKLTK